MVIGSAVGWSALGVVATLICALVAERLGWVQISIMREAHALNLSKAVPQVGCSVSVSYQQINSVGFNPHAFVTVEIYNEGELAARDIKGEWILRAPALTQQVFPIERDFLGNCQQHKVTHKIDQSVNWPAHVVLFEVDLTFDYTIPSEQVRSRYSANYRYDTKSRQMLKA